MDYSKQLDDYKRQSVYSMTQGEMLLLLFDEMIKRLKRSKLWLEKKDYDNYEKDLKKAIDIIRYLRKILNMQYPISLELHRLYTFYDSHMSRALVSRKAEQIDDLIPMIQDIRDAFKSADIMARDGKGADQSQDPRHTDTLAL